MSQLQITVVPIHRRVSSVGFELGVALILSETTAISTERYNFSLFIVKVFSGKLFQKKIPDFCAKRG